MDVLSVEAKILIQLYNVCVLELVCSIFRNFFCTIIANVIIPLECKCLQLNVLFITKFPSRLLEFMSNLPNASRRAVLHKAGYIQQQQMFFFQETIGNSLKATLHDTNNNYIVKELNVYKVRQCLLKSIMLTCVDKQSIDFWINSCLRVVPV